MSDSYGRILSDDEMAYVSGGDPVLTMLLGIPCEETDDDNPNKPKVELREDPLP